MNNKEKLIEFIIDTSIEKCNVKTLTGEDTVTKELLINKSRKENVVLTRAMIILLLKNNGFTNQTCADILSMTTVGVRNAIQLCNYQLRDSEAFRTSYSEITLGVRDFKTKLKEN